MKVIKNIVDLSHFSCPQLFVQFKWGLKQLECHERIVFTFTKQQELNDVMRYLNQGHYLHQISLQDEQLNISVERISV